MAGRYPHPASRFGWHERTEETCGRPRPCRFLERWKVGRRNVYKCVLRGASASSASDHRLSERACAVKSMSDMELTAKLRSQRQAERLWDGS